jgi:hypothetical protein
VSPSCISVFKIPQLVLVLRHINPFLTLYSDSFAIHPWVSVHSFLLPLIWFMPCLSLIYLDKHGAASLHDCVSIQMTQTSVNRLTKRILQCAVYFYYLLNLQHLFDIRSSVFSAQLTKLWYRFTYWLVQPCTGLPVNRREFFRVIDFGATLY